MAASSTAAPQAPPQYVALVGVLGCGKSTLAKALSESWHLPLFEEPVIDNKKLEDFYANMKANAFSFQIHLLNQRFEQQQRLVWQKQGGVQDRSIYEDSIFARVLTEDGLMRKEDLETYVRLFQNMSNFMTHPTLLVYLKTSPEECLRRVRRRDRACEAGITLDYLTKLFEAYEVFIAEIAKKIPVITIDWNSYSDPWLVATRIVESYNRDIAVPKTLLL